MSCPWGSADAVGIDSFCEQMRACDWVLQPSNASSSVAFIVAAALFCWQAHASGARVLWVLAACAGLLFIGTAAQHISGTRWGMLLDHAGMESLNVVMACVGLRRWRRWSWPTLATLGICAWLLLVVLTALFGSVRRAVMVAGMVPCAALELGLWFRDGDRTNYRWLVVGWLLFIVAIAAWAADTSGWICNPQSVFQLHAVWHVGTAAALLAWGAYYLQFTALQPRRLWEQT